MTGDGSRPSDGTTRHARGTFGRRWSLKSGGAIALCLAALSVPAAAQDRIDGDRYQNPRYGIEISKPSRWYFITASMIVDIARKSARMAPPGGDADPVKTAGFAVIVSKVPALGRDAAPLVVLRVEDLPSAPTDVIATCERLRGGVSDPETVLPTRVISIDGRPAARLDFKGSVDGAPVRATALCTFQNRRAFVVVGQALASEFDAEAGTFDTILRSFRLR
jgi:hypothetical protein